MSGKSRVKRNIAANVAGGTWGVILSLLVIPFQFKILGAEAYGLITFIVPLQIVFSVLDFGLSTTIVREVAGDTSPDRRVSRELLQTAAAIYWVIAATLGAALALAANWISLRWLTLETLTPEYAAGALRIMVAWLVFSWPLSLYSNFITGLQRLDIVNGLRVVMGTLTAVGGVIILVLTHSLYLFLTWRAAVSFASLVVHAITCQRLVPDLSLALRFSPGAIRRVWHLALDLNIISATAIVFTQTDRLLISLLLPIRMLGYFSVAYNVTRGIATVQEFFNKAMLPTLSADHNRGNLELLRARYAKYAQLLIYIVALPAFALVFFGFDFLRVWTTLDTAQNAHIVLSILAIGFFFNASMSPSYTLAVASGHTRLPLKINLYALPLYVPCLYFAIKFLGIEGAALVWVLLNIYYLASLLPFTQRKILGATPWTWLGKSFLPFALLAPAAFGVGRMLASVPVPGGAWRVWLAALLAVTSYSVGGYFFLQEPIRRDILNTLRRLFTVLRLLPARGSDVPSGH